MAKGSSGGSSESKGETSPPTKKFKSDSTADIVTSSGITQLKVDKFSYKWTINNYSFSCHETHEVLKSPKFLIRANSKLRWMLRLYPKGNSQEHSNSVILFLECNSKGKEIGSLKVTFTISIIDDKGVKRMKNSQEKLFSLPYSSVGLKLISIADLLNNKAMLVPNDSLTILCEMLVSSEDKSSIQITGDQVEVPKRTLINEIKTFFESKDFSDVTIVVSRSRFPVHKVVLAARSKVFLDMLKLKSQGKRGNIININDIKPEVLREILRYMYTEEVENMPELGKEIFEAAVKYEIEGLKIYCEKTFSSKLNVRNVIETLIFADGLNALYLKNQSMIFINTHIKDLMDTAEFKSLEKTHPTMMIQILKKVIK